MAGDNGLVVQKTRAGFRGGTSPRARMFVITVRAAAADPRLKIVVACFCSVTWEQRSHRNARYGGRLDPEMTPFPGCFGIIIASIVLLLPGGPRCAAAHDRPRCGERTGLRKTQACFEGSLSSRSPRHAGIGIDSGRSHELHQVHPSSSAFFLAMAGTSVATNCRCRICTPSM